MVAVHLPKRRRHFTSLHAVKPRQQPRIFSSVPDNITKSHQGTCLGQAESNPHHTPCLQVIPMRYLPMHQALSKLHSIVQSLHVSHFYLSFGPKFRARGQMSRTPARAHTHTQCTKVWIKPQSLCPPVNQQRRYKPQADVPRGLSTVSVLLPTQFCTLKHSYRLGDLGLSQRYC
jgi:hypothetical protein